MRGAEEEQLWQHALQTLERAELQLWMRNGSVARSLRKTARVTFSSLLLFLIGARIPERTAQCSGREDQGKKKQKQKRILHRNRKRKGEMCEGHWLMEPSVVRSTLRCCSAHRGQFAVQLSLRSVRLTAPFAHLQTCTAHSESECKNFPLHSDCWRTAGAVEEKMEKKEKGRREYRRRKRSGQNQNRKKQQ